MSNEKEVFERLAAPFSDEEVSWRPQSATTSNNGEYKLLMVPYITATQVTQRLNQVVPGDWSEEYIPWNINKKEGISCMLTIYFGEKKRTYQDAGITSGENDLKGSFSDAFKRTARKVGIGLYVAEASARWVTIFPNRANKATEYFSGKVKINKSEHFVKGYYEKPSIPVGKKQFSNQKEVITPNNKPDSSSSKMEIDSKKNFKKAPEDAERLSKILNYLDISEELIPRISKKKCGESFSLDTATPGQIKQIFDLIDPVYKFAAGGRKLKISDEQLFQYAQIDTGEQINSFCKMLFRVDDAAYIRMKEFFKEHIPA